MANELSLLTTPAKAGAQLGKHALVSAVPAKLPARYWAPAFAGVEYK